VLVLSAVSVCVRYVRVHPHADTHTRVRARESTNTPRTSAIQVIDLHECLTRSLLCFNRLLFLKCSLKKKKKRKRKKESILGTENSSVTASSPLLHRGQESVSINRKKMTGMEPLSIYNVDNRPGFGLNMCPFLGTSRLPFLLLLCFTQLFGPSGQPPPRGSWKTPMGR